MDIAYLGDAPGKGDSTIEHEVTEDFTRDRIEDKDDKEIQYSNRVKSRI